MNESDPQIPAQDVLRAEALAWLRRLNSGQATADDVKELENWRARSAAHSREFAEAALLWTVLGEAAQKAEAGRAGLATAHVISASGKPLARRAFLVGGGALAASVTGALILRPPFDLWPSYLEFMADYRTRTGERQQIEIANRVVVEMNTRTSIDLRPAADGTSQIELLTGETAIAKRDDSSRELVIVAGGGHAATTRASFNIRKDSQLVSVTCIDGSVHVRCGAGETVVQNGQQVTYDNHGLGEVTAIDPEVITGWQRGLLIFRRVSLSHVIDEVNRYRAGSIVLLDAKLGRRQVVANFRLDRIDEVIDFISKAMDIRTRSLPGGIVLVG